jgi:hypothetical protein
MATGSRFDPCGILVPKKYFKSINLELKDLLKFRDIKDPEYNK